MDINEINSISSSTCIDSCNGICRRVLKDIENNFNDSEMLLDAYIIDLNQGGRDYSSIIQLGLLLKQLDDKYKQLK